ncbi:hypothetical protein MMC25_007146 [Agyrium rufum]|nr:hypothetical protein [Agyrium rufum]
MATPNSNRSPYTTPSHSRNTSNASSIRRDNAHAPSTPSRLWQSHEPSPSPSPSPPNHNDSSSSSPSQGRSGNQDQDQDQQQHPQRRRRASSPPPHSNPSSSPPTTNTTTTAKKPPKNRISIPPISAPPPQEPSTSTSPSTPAQPPLGPHPTSLTTAPSPPKPISSSSSSSAAPGPSSFSTAKATLIEPSARESSLIGAGADEEHVDAHAKLLASYNRMPATGSCCGGGACEHGGFSPRPGVRRSALSFEGEGRGYGSFGDDEAGEDSGGGGGSEGRGGGGGGEDSTGDGSGGGDSNDGRFGSDGARAEGNGHAYGYGKDGEEESWWSSWSFSGAWEAWKHGGHEGKKMSTTQWLARRHGVKNSRRMYLAYYLPVVNWASQYHLYYLQGDIVAALTMASFYIPMALSYASNLGHIPPINGLYSFVFNPLIYAFLGTCPQMVVGPEAAGSLLLGSVVRSSVDKGNSGDEDEVLNARIAGVVTGMAGAVILIAGITRLGFLDSVLSRPFLRGFISAIGILILVDQLIPEMGLATIAKHTEGVSHGSSITKIVFLAKNLGNAHGLTCGVAFGAFVIIMICRTLKKRLQPRYPSVAYIPDRFVVVVMSAVLTYAFHWDQQGLQILGKVESSTGTAFPFHWPFVPAHMKHVREAMSTSFLIALLGFFESSVAAKALGIGEHKNGEGLQGISLSANRELVALGVANIVGSCFMALPAFGGYGRSKINAATGGRTPMSSIMLSGITLICVLYLLPYFYYLPKAVLSAMVSVVAYSLIEECPHDIKFFIKIRGWSELTLIFLIFAATVFYSLPLGIALGMGLSILSVIRHATKPRIQILGKVPGTTDEFENAEDNPQGLEFFDGCLIIKIPEPLTFANTGDLKSRLRRLEIYGTTSAHPALPRVRDDDSNQNIIFDVHGVTGLDGSGTYVLTEIVEGYTKRGVRVFFCRVPKPTSPVYQMFVRSGIVEMCGGPRHFVKSVDEALRMTEMQSLEDWWRDRPALGA